MPFIVVLRPEKAKMDFLDHVLPKLIFQFSFKILTPKIGNIGDQMDYGQRK